ncbi:hypothetical protein DPQ33_07310 [Oceanidesulfovibrio indonesiensis]|uniref:histidine kinase n=1 Tax=Oceanidesulfovibrio indonesiensis TaxID=54767 RepID=A0A7M3MFL4_9BACT|nr:ATP-binding protein [Oceanidesulfovibrio indonesiensis]TVM17910.1 hypothetical protein DPQ33_07310 [Oceanidesulfovibrio indonesiensis]
MHSFRTLSIGRKLLLVIMLTSMTAVVLASGALLLNDYLSFRKGMARDLGVITAIIAENLNAALYFQDPDAAHETLSALDTNPRIRGGWLYAADGSLFAAYARQDAEVARMFTSLGIPMFGDGMRLESDIMARYLPVHVQGERVGTLYVESDLQELENRLHANLGIALLVFAAASFVALVLSAFFQRLISRPVSALAETARRISRDKDYTLRAELFGEDELGQFAMTFNEMLDEVQRRDEALARYSRELELEIAERGRVQQELQVAKEAAEESNRIKSEFLSMVSHELRTPLTSVRGYAKLSHKRLQRFIFPCVPDDDPRLDKVKHQVDSNMQIIVSESERLTYLINDVLDLNKLDAGVVDWNMEAHDLGEIVEHALNVCGNLFDGKDVVGSMSIAEDIPPVRCDRNRILQVLINLISNAAKFTNSGEVAVHVDRGPGELVVSVSDTGVGIRPEHREAIFERFRQLGDTLTDKPAGTGLGLAICKEIVEVHGGRIWMEPNTERGSVFRFTLPFAGQASSQPGR